MSERALLALEDGTFYKGYHFGYPTDVEAEVVFATCMTGYQEICTDPSYHGQIVVFTYPLIGNYGINENDMESRKPWAAGIIVREYSEEFSNWQAKYSLGEYLKKHKMPGIMGIDTRALTRHLRQYGTMKGVITSFNYDSEIELSKERAANALDISEKALVEEASYPQKIFFDPIGMDLKITIAVIDCGIKQNIIRCLRNRGACVWQLPFNSTVDEILSFKPDGVLFSNGPGDPSRVKPTIQTMKKLINTGIPIMGICLGHQVLAQAIGGKTSRLKFGHHGGNHPVKDLLTNRIHITSQNHEFQVDADSIPANSGFYVNLINLNDNSVEGLAHKELPIFSVQYHPEASPGPQDNLYVFDKFIDIVLKKEKTW